MITPILGGVVIFSTGFAAGYATRLTMSVLRRHRIRKIKIASRMV